MLTRILVSLCVCHVWRFNMEIHREFQWKWMLYLDKVRNRTRCMAWLRHHVLRSIFHRFFVKDYHKLLSLLPPDGHKSYYTKTTASTSTNLRPLKKTNIAILILTHPSKMLDSSYLKHTLYETYFLFGQKNKYWFRLFEQHRWWLYK